MKTKHDIPENQSNMLDVTKYLYKWQVVAIMLREAQNKAYRGWIPKWAWDLYKDEIGYMDYVLKQFIKEDPVEVIETPTERPWAVTDQNAKGKTRIIDSGGFTVAYCDIPSLSQAENEANAKLIAKAVNRDHLFDSALDKLELAVHFIPNKDERERILELLKKAQVKP